MKILIILTVLFSLINSTPVSALVVEDQRGKIEIPLRPDWKYEKDLMGLPHVFLSSEKPQRTTLSVTLTGIEGVKLPSKDLKKNQSQYQEGRKKWAQKRGIRVEEFHSYKEFRSASGHVIHEIGFDYEIGKILHSEKSYYLECPLSLVHVKIVGILGAEKLTEAQSSIPGIRCL